MPDISRISREGRRRGKARLPPGRRRDRRPAGGSGRPGRLAPGRPHRGHRDGYPHGEGLERALKRACLRDNPFPGREGHPLHAHRRAGGARPRLAAPPPRRRRHLVRVPLTEPADEGGSINPRPSPSRRTSSPLRKARARGWGAAAGARVCRGGDMGIMDRTKERRAESAGPRTAAFLF